MARRRSAGTFVIIGTIVAVVLATTAVVFVVIMTSHEGSRYPVQAETTIFVSATCTSSTATTSGLSTTTYVRSFIGNLTIITERSQFSSNVTAICG